MNAKGVVQIIIGAGLFGLIPFFVRYAPDLNVASIAFGRACFATLFALILMFFIKDSAKNQKEISLQYSLFHLLNWSVFLTFAIVFYFLSIKNGSVAIAGTMMGMHPVFVVLFSYLLFKEKIFLKTYLSCLVAIIGGGLIAFANNANSSATFEGSIYGLLSAVFLGINFTYHLKYLTHFSSIKLVFFQNALQLPILLPFVFIFPSKLSSEGWTSIVFLGIVCTGLAYFLVYNGSKFVSKQYIGVLQMIENIIPVFLGVIIYHEMIHLQEISGIILIVLSALLISVKL
ncbi:MAG: EamA family transporter [Flavobacteriia bacterium]|nr:EamA family transporter [Flavobacteriia bacterium]